MREVVTHATTALHKLHLLLVHAEDTTVRVCGVLVSDNEAVRERCHLEVVADTCHGATLRDDIAEVVEQVEDLLLRQWVGVVTLDARELACDTVVHIAGRSLVDVAERVLQSVLAHPHLCGEFVTCEILLRSRYCVLVLHSLKLFIVSLLSHNCMSFLLSISALCLATLGHKCALRVYKIRDFSRDYPIFGQLFFRHFIHKK